MQRLLAAKARAADLAARARREHDEGTLTLEGFSAYLEEYVLAKYRLDSGECPSRKLDDLAEASLAKTLSMGLGDLAGVDTAANCDGADSVTVKQALLLVAIQKDFVVKLDGFEVAFLETLDELAENVWRRMEAM